LGNDDISKPSEKDRKRLENAAVEKGWPLAWKGEYDKFIYEL
jgi:hypothetical protein